MEQMKNYMAIYNALIHKLTEINSTVAETVELPPAPPSDALPPAYTYKTLDECISNIKIDLKSKLTKEDLLSYGICQYDKIDIYGYNQFNNNKFNMYNTYNKPLFLNTKITESDKTKILKFVSGYSVDDTATQVLNLGNTPGESSTNAPTTSVLATPTPEALAAVKQSLRTPTPSQLPNETLKDYKKPIEPEYIKPRLFMWYKGIKEKPIIQPTSYTTDINNILSRTFVPNQIINTEHIYGIDARIAEYTHRLTPDQLTYITTTITNISNDTTYNVDQKQSLIKQLYLLLTKNNKHFIADKLKLLTAHKNENNYKFENELIPYRNTTTNKIIYQKLHEILTALQNTPPTTSLTDNIKCILVLDTDLKTLQSTPIGASNEKNIVGGNKKTRKRKLNTKKKLTKHKLL